MIDDSNNNRLHFGGIVTVYLKKIERQFVI